MKEVCFFYSPPWPTWSPNYTIALFDALSRNLDIKFHGLDLNTDLYNACNEEEKKLWQDEDSNKWLIDDYIDEFFCKKLKFLQNYIKNIINENTLTIGISVRNTSVSFALKFAKLIRVHYKKLRLFLEGLHVFE